MPGCPLCSEPDIQTVEVRDDVYRCKCPRCGTFEITWEVLNFRDQLPSPDQIHLLSGEARNRFIRDPAHPLVLSMESVKVAMGRLSKLTVLDKAAATISYLATVSKFPGDEVGLRPQMDYTVSYASNQDEFRYLLSYLASRGLIEATNTMGGPYSCVLTVVGWEEAQRNKAVPVMSDRSFVAMSFTPDLKPLYEDAIEPAIRKAGYQPVRIDFVEHVDRIDDRILFEIKRSKFLVADFTQQKRGVYFEAGYALALGIPVIWTCKSNEVSELHFDISHYNHLLWDAPSDLRDPLHRRIVVIIGQGPLNVGQ